MWILNDTIIGKPRAITIEGIQHPIDIFTRWSVAQLAVIGIKPYQDDSYNSEFYKSESTYLEEVDGIVFRRHNLVERYSLTALRQYLKAEVESVLKSLYKDCRAEIIFLNEFDPLNDTVDNYSTYLDDLKAAYIVIKNTVQTLLTYEQLVDYAWLNALPTPAGEM